MTIETTVLEAALAGLLWRARQMGLAPQSPNASAWDELAQRAARLGLGGESGSAPASQNRALRSIFSSVTADEVTGNLRYVPVGPLELTEAVIFPQEKPDLSPLKAHTNTLKQALGALLDGQPVDETRLEAALAVLQRYGWCLPGGQDDVSLYDEARITAALAVCLAQNNQQVMLVGGDISGVQDFIYTITDKGATSALRGRSFYLQLLTETAARFVLRELGLPYTNLIYGGGGNFYLLARAGDTEKLKDTRQKLSRILYKHHQGDVYVALAGHCLNPENIQGAALGAAWSNLALELAAAKNRRFAELPGAELAAFFQPHGLDSGPDKQCDVCGREHPNTRVWDDDRPDNPGEDAPQKCPACHAYEVLGDQLRQAEYIGWGPAPAQRADDGQGYEGALRDLGFAIKIGQNSKDMNGFSRIWALSDKALKDASGQANGKVLARRLLVNVTPMFASQNELDTLRNSGVKDLPQKHVDKQGKPRIKMVQALAYQSRGITRLGVFRADVDNLGTIFASGLKKRASLTRIAALSFAFSLFFEGWVGEIAKTRNSQNGDRLYAIYSGGDDLFFVGSWDELVEFAWQVNEDLHKYTGGHPGIHISGGMALVTEKYPLAKAAQDAEKAEKAAKNLTWWDENRQPHRKNVFSFLGQPLPWSEFKNARELKGRLAGVDASKRTAVIRKLLMNYALYAEAEKKRREAGKDIKPDKKPQTLYGPWNWRILYLLRRMFGKDSEKMDTNEQTLITDFHTRPDMLEYTGVGARWAELLKRNSQEKE